MNRRLASSAITTLLLGLVMLADAGSAGNGRLVSQWMSRVPAIDGRIAAEEWSGATVVDLGAGVTVWIGNDARTLYFAALDSGDLTPHGYGAHLYLWFDDEGGVAPVLDDGALANGACTDAPNLGEGQLLFWAQEVHFGRGLCDFVPITDRMSSHVAARPEGLTYETAIPLDGPAPLRARPGERFAFMIAVMRDYNIVACLPACDGFGNPPGFRNLILASGGCNTGPQDFGSGDPLIGLPLDWSSHLLSGAGPSWVQSPPQHYGDQVFCQSNETGGAGAAACVANALATTATVDAVLSTLLPVAGQESATLRLRALFEVGPVSDRLSVWTTRPNDYPDNLLAWSQAQSATVVLPLTHSGSPLVELLFLHSTQSGGGVEGGHAQIDDVELLCGPVLFADGFQSGLTTHWSATTP
jgi:hypothetical protein